MTRTLALLAVTALLYPSSPVAAQFIFGPGYPVGGYRPVVIVRPVIAVVERRIILRPAPQPQYDLSGIDLDVESPDKLYPPGTAPQRLPAPRPVEVNRQPPAPAKLPPPKEVKPPPPPKPPADDLLRPRPTPPAEAQRLAELGSRAFRAGEYGTARFRFGQATEVDPAAGRPWFLLAQAHYAVAEYDAAVRALHDGLKLNADWPLSAFRPRVDLYGDRPDDWLQQLGRLDDALKRKPNDAALLFLRGYVAWFDGQRDQAVEWFMKARARTADRRFIELFLKHAPPPAVAAS